MCTTTEVAPDYIRGFERRKGFCAKVFMLMTMTYLIALIPGSYLKPAESLCPENELDCKRPELFAHEFLGISCFVWFAFISIRSWHLRKSQLKDFPDNPIGRVFGYSEESELIGAVSLTFQFWDLVATPFVPEFYTPIMIGHHVCAALVSFVSLQYQFYHYYVIFFFALSEVSSISLGILSLCKYFPAAPGSIQETVESIAGPLFAITFSYYRVYLWIKVTYQLWSDGIDVLSSGASDKYRPGKNFALYLMLTVSALLTLLQLYWFSLIVSEVLKMVGFDVPNFNAGF